MTQPDATKSDATAQAQAKAQRLAAAFTEVFGQGARRTESQKLVMDHLALRAGDDANSYRFNEGKDGIALIAGGIHRDGAKSILRIIERQLEIAGRNGDPRKEKPKTTR